MDRSSSRQHQEMPNTSMESMVIWSKEQQERKARPQPEQALKCPRCDSINTKFCYYNNYSLSQPRYFCKSCRRYWTKGGTLRNVPMGGGLKKNKRSYSSSKRSQDRSLTTLTASHIPPLSYGTNKDFGLAFARLQEQSDGQLGFDDHDISVLGNPVDTYCDSVGNPSLNSNAADSLAFLDPLRSSFLGNLNNFQGFYYGLGDQNMGEVEMMLPYNNNEEMSNATTATISAVTVTTMNQVCNNGRES